MYFELELARGEQRRLDHGQPSRWPTWRGTLRARTGAEHLGGALLELSSRQRNPSLLRTRVPDDGRFELPLVPGAYDVWARLGEDEEFRVELGGITVGPDGLDTDLVLPGTRLSGWVHAAAPDLDLALGTRAQPLRISVRLEGHDYPAAVRGAPVDARGSYAIDALKPGVYLVNAHPLPIAGGRDSLRVEIRPGEDEVVLDVFVDRP